ncbi:MAG: transposase [Limnochordia bacterium]|nr:transposase [Limnochordia bacterium]
MKRLEKQRGNGRDDYPVRAMWNLLLAAIVIEHKSVESLRRELNRNGQLRHFCGLGNIPSASAYSRFIKKPKGKLKDVADIFCICVDELYDLVPEFGKDLAIDGKGIPSYARRKPKNKAPDGRRDVDATHWCENIQEYLQRWYCSKEDYLLVWL